MTDWTKKFNELPKEIRVIGSAMEAQTRIQHLKLEKDRLRKRYQQSCREINEHIKSCEKWIADLDAPNAVPDRTWKAVRSAAFQGTCRGILLGLSYLIFVPLTHTRSNRVARARGSGFRSYISRAHPTATSAA